MKKKILFIIMSLEMGGAEKALINLLNEINYDLYSVDLLLFQKKGILLSDVPKNVNIIEDENIRVLYQSAHTSIKTNKVSFKLLRLIMTRYIGTLIERIIHFYKSKEQRVIYRWNHFYSKKIKHNDNYYDIAIAFSGREPIYYLIDKISSDKKICYFHSDYSKMKLEEDKELVYLNKCNKVITISDICKLSLENIFKELKPPIIVLENLSSVNSIIKKSDEFVPNEFSNANNKLKIITVGRLSQEKGMDIAIEAAHNLKQLQVEFRWCIVGSGPEQEKLIKLIKKYNLETNIHLVGLKSNPYPYIKNADILVQPSRFEGKSIVIDEAKILNVPIVCTNYTSSVDQIKHNVNGIISDMNGKSLANCIIELMNDKEKYDNIKYNLSQEIINKFDSSKYINTLFK